MILRHLFCFKNTKKIQFINILLFETKKLIFNVIVNRNWKKLTDSRKRAKILTDNRKYHHPIKTLFSQVSADSFRFNIQKCSKCLYAFIAFRPTCFARRLVMRNLHETSTQRAR